MRALVQREGMEQEIELDSAGTGSWHVGSAPDRRAAAAAATRGVTLAGAARQVSPRDFEDFDVILAMDRSNASDLRALAPDEQARSKVRLLREFEVDGRRTSGELDVTDPYHGGEEGFDEVFALVEAACEGLLEDVRAGRVP